MSAPVAVNYRIGLVAWAALTVLQLIWHAWLFPAQSMPLAFVLGITVIPLLLPLLALRDVRRALLWGLVFALCVTKMASVSEFLYFQF